MELQLRDDSESARNSRARARENEVPVKEIDGMLLPTRGRTRRAQIPISTCMTNAWHASGTRVWCGELC